MLHIAINTELFPAEDISKVFADADRFDWEESTVSKDNEPSNLRTGRVKGLRADEDNKWLYEKIIAILSNLNASTIHQDWFGVVETIQFAKYDVGDHYDIHFDGFEAIHRKLSLTVQLSEAKDYEGGLLQIGLPNNPVTMITDQGSVVCFPSWMPHAVEPVTEGTRYSLVAWGHGPPVR